MNNLSSGKNPPEEINVVIEIPQGSLVKYELDKDSGYLFVDRFAFTTMGYPANYGFVPNTVSGDGDPVDVLVLSIYPVHPGTVIPALPIGLLAMEDESGIDAKVIAVPPMKVDPFFGRFKDLSDVDEATRNRIKHFFEKYKELEVGKWVKVKDWKGKEAALEEVRRGLK
ncbi:inorganic diphosphatase [Candidatus Gottesmanbacteria bacterium]|nr:inorganic diphosphatase [Candidatus Gottesmanbacteria bacterium]